MARRGALTVEVTSAASVHAWPSSRNYSRALIAAETKWDRARRLGEAVRSARAEVRYEPDPTLSTPGKGSLSVSFPSVRSER